MREVYEIKNPAAAAVKREAEEDWGETRAIISEVKTLELLVHPLQRRGEDLFAL